MIIWDDVLPTASSKPINTLSLQGAQELRRRIEVYWATRGVQAEVRVEQMAGPRGDRMMVVRSDLGARFGWPKDARKG